MRKSARINVAKQIIVKDGCRSRRVKSDEDSKEEHAHFYMQNWGRCSLGPGVAPKPFE